jgi:hypothetical protein
MTTNKSVSEAKTYYTKEDFLKCMKHQSEMERKELDTRKKKEKQSELIGIAIGEASMCWSEVPKGIFDSTKAIEIKEKLIADLNLLDVHDIANVDQLERENRELRNALEKLLKFTTELCEDVGISAHYPSIEKAREVLK